MESTTTAERSLSASPSVWPIIVQAFIGAFFVGDAVIDRWGTMGIYGKVVGIALLINLVLAPTMTLLRQRSGKEVSFSNLAANGYALVWITAYVLTRHSH
jgi:O-antigen ligase